MNFYLKMIHKFEHVELTSGFGQALIAADVSCLENGLEMTTNVVALAIDKARTESMRGSL